METWQFWLFVSGWPIFWLALVCIAIYYPEVDSANLGMSLYVGTIFSPYAFVVVALAIVRVEALVAKMRKKVHGKV